MSIPPVSPPFEWPLDFGEGGGKRIEKNNDTIKDLEIDKATTTSTASLLETHNAKLTFFSLDYNNLAQVVGRVRERPNFKRFFGVQLKIEFGRSIHHL